MMTPETSPAEPLAVSPHRSTVFHMETRASAVAAVVEEHRLAMGLTQEALADATGIPLTTLHRSLHGHRAFDADELFRVADALGVTVSALTREAEGRSGSAA